MKCRKAVGSSHWATCAGVKGLDQPPRPQVCLLRQGLAGGHRLENADCPDKSRSFGCQLLLTEHRHGSLPGLLKMRYPSSWQRCAFHVSIASTVREPGSWLEAGASADKVDPGPRLRNARQQKPKTLRCQEGAAELRDNTFLEALVEKWSEPTVWPRGDLPPRRSLAKGKGRRGDRGDKGKSLTKPTPGWTI